MKMRLERARLNRQDHLIDKIEKAVNSSELKTRPSTSRSNSSLKTIVLHGAEG